MVFLHFCSPSLAGYQPLAVSTLKHTNRFRTAAKCIRVSHADELALLSTQPGWISAAGSQHFETHIGSALLQNASVYLVLMDLLCHMESAFLQSSLVVLFMTDFSHSGLYFQSRI